MNKPLGLNKIQPEIRSDVLRLLQRFAGNNNRLTRGDLKNEDEDMLRYLVELELITAEHYKSGGKVGWPRAYLLTSLGVSAVSETPFISVTMLDWTWVEQATNKYGPLGLRTAAQIAFGNSHALDAHRDNPELSRLNVWHQTDIKPPAGANLVRVGGKIRLENQWRCFKECWQPPGHFLWDWDLTELTVVTAGQRLILVENPYAMWELMVRWNGEDITLACIHGETLYTEDMNSALSRFLEQLYQAHPHLETWIWCDPDLAGLRIASRVHHLVQTLGGRPQFWLMGETILDQLTELILAERKLRPLEERELQTFSYMMVHSDLHPLASAIQKRKQRGEQEALVVTVKPNVG